MDLKTLLEALVDRVYQRIHRHLKSCDVVFPRLSLREHLPDVRHNPWSLFLDDRLPVFANDLDGAKFLAEVLHTSRDSFNLGSTMFDEGL